jgi:hypothetical protein
MTFEDYVKDLFQQILEWYEKKKGPLPIRPQLRVFPDLKAFLDFVKPEPGHIEAVCILHYDKDGGKVTIAINAQNVQGDHEFTTAFLILHELEHAREQTANGVMTFNLIEPAQETRKREVRVSIEAFQLAQEFTGLKMPKIIQKYVEQRFENEIVP